MMTFDDALDNEPSTYGPDWHTQLAKYFYNAGKTEGLEEAAKVCEDCKEYRMDGGAYAGIWCDARDDAAKEIRALKEGTNG